MSGLKKLSAIIFLLFVITVPSAAQVAIDTFAVIRPQETQRTASQFVTMLLNKYHYKKVDLNDQLSEEIFNEYLRGLDPQRYYFLQSDIEGFEQYRFVFDQMVMTGNLDPAYEIYNVYKTRVTERINYVVSLMDKEPDFTVDEYFTADRDSADYCKTVSELNDLWRKRIKFDAIQLMINGKKWEEAAETLKKRFTGFHKSVLQYKAEDVFQIFMSSVTDVFDPHTNYFAPRNSDNFNISMSLTLEGIGATLTTENDYTTIVSLVPGGPAALSGKINKGDKIVAVAQGDTGTFVDVYGWRVDEVVQLIRGPKGTVVRLTILPASEGLSAKAQEVTIVRDKIKLEEQAAKKEIIEIKEGEKDYKLGVIVVPAFYLDFEGRRKGDPDYKSTTRDVKKLIKECQEEGVDGIIMDLRNNGGGSLLEAVELTGLFIKKGPVVMVRDAQGDVDVERDKDESFTYNGPMAVLVNYGSASASDIFSSAIQDYGRGLIVGENTFGKGTVQNLLDLDQFMKTGNKMGQLTVTVAKYYRISGGSVQNKGVVPDVSFPAVFDADEFGEKSYKNALPWDTITPTVYASDNSLHLLIPDLIKKHLERTGRNTEFKYYAEDLKSAKERRNQKVFSLNLEKRKKENEEQKAIEEKRKLERIAKGEIELDDKGEVKERKLKVSDPLLEETGHILANLIVSYNPSVK
ncbi:MAG: carboxy terminal-processing peptidase [Ignavibacteriaceae bacterium]|nr:carboxy terminal-processing peptidase [Ignavibacteriaceae bacterium]